MRLLAVVLVAHSLSSTMGQDIETVTMGRDLAAEVGTLIVGGTKVTNVNSYPWITSLQRGSHYCGGALIHPKWVLTAAHCGPGTPSLIRMKTLKHKSGGVTATAKRMITHPAYDPETMENDIALIELNSPVNNVPLVQIATSDLYNGAGELLKVIGWGTQSSGASNLPKDLMQVQVPVVSNTACGSSYSDETIGDGMLCAGYPQGRKDSCQGDSGGPLFKELGGGANVLTGVVSWAYGCASSSYPGVYTRVNSYISWLQGIDAEIGVPPTASPTLSPVTLSPTLSPVTLQPTTGQPTSSDPYIDESLFCDTFPTAQCNKKSGRRCLYNRGRKACIPKMKQPTAYPTSRPSKNPTPYPTGRPTTGRPSKSPTKFPTNRPSTGRPTSRPTTLPPVKSEYEYEYEE